MTDQRLHDLLHESVSDATMPDVADAAWRTGIRNRRRRTAGLAAGATALVVGVAGTVALVDRGSSDPGVSTGPPSHSVTPTTPSTSAPTRGVTPYIQSDSTPDARYQGTSVWWSPRVAQESALPAYPASPLPVTIDLSAPESPLASDPLSHALAAFAVASDTELQSVHVLGPDGLLRLVDIGPDPGRPARVQPMRDPEGNLRVDAGVSMLSPSGEYLMFPQQRSVAVLRLRDDVWSTIDTGAHDTWNATWTSNDEILLWDPARPTAPAPAYDVHGNRVETSLDLSSRYSGTPYGLPRRSPAGPVAQTYVAGANVPQPPSLHLSPRQSDWIGVAGAPDSILVLPQEAERQKQCCQVGSWLDRDTLLYESRSSEGLRLLAWRVGTGRFWQVSQVVGFRMGEQSVVSSYADLSAFAATSPR